MALGTVRDEDVLDPQWKGDPFEDHERLLLSERLCPQLIVACDLNHHQQLCRWASRVLFAWEDSRREGLVDEDTEYSWIVELSDGPLASVVGSRRRRMRLAKSRRSAVGVEAWEWNVVHWIRVMRVCATPEECLEVGHTGARRAWTSCRDFGQTAGSHWNHLMGDFPGVVTILVRP